MTKKNERTILFLDLHIQTKTKSPNIRNLPNHFSLNELMEKIVALRECNNVNVLLGSGENQKEIYLAEVEQDESNDCWKLLINITDTTFADEVHREIGGSYDTRKVFSKTEGVGTDFSSHIMIKSTPQSNGSWVVLLEQSSALPVKLVSRYLNELFRRLTQTCKEDFQVDHPKNAVDRNGHVKKINTYCNCHFNGHISLQFQDDLNRGTLKTITLITGRIDSIDGYDVQKHTSVKEVLLPIRINKDEILKAGGNFKWFDRLRNNDAKELNMQEIKVSFRDDGDVPHTAKIDIHSGCLIDDDKYVKKVKIIDFKDMLTTSVDTFYKPIMSKMLEHL